MNTQQSPLLLCARTFAERHWRHGSRSFLRLLAIGGILFGPRLPAKAVTGEDAPPVPKVQDFALETTCQLGREIYREDQLAWVASDVLEAGVPRERLDSEHVSGWVVETTGAQPIVRFLRQQGDKLEAAYDVVFAKGKKPTLVQPKDRELTKPQLARARAEKTALAALQNRKLPWCGGNPNFVVLGNPLQEGWLVYVLRPKERADEIPIGGNYRVWVTADGATVTKVDQLFASCLTLSKTPPKEANGVAALMMSQIVSDRPLETHVFLSLQDRVPLYVVTPDGKLWLVERGKITPVKDADLKQPAATTPSH